MVPSTEFKNNKAENRDIMAQCEIGECYFSTERVPQNYDEAANWCLSGYYEMDYSEIIFNLGLCYFKGKCVPHDFEEAYFWFFIAAGNGHEEASALKDDLAQLLSDKQIQTMQEKAIEWFNNNIVPYLS